MSTPIESKLITAMAANVGLQGLLGTSPMRVFDTQEVPGSTFPAVTIMTVSDVKTYGTNGRLQVARYRIQFTIWGGQFSAGNVAAAAVRDALLSFMDGFSALIGSQIASQFVLDRRAMFPRTDGPIFQRVMDAMIYSDDSL